MMIIDNGWWEEIIVVKISEMDKCCSIRMLGYFAKNVCRIFENLTNQKK